MNKNLITIVGVSLLYLGINGCRDYMTDFSKCKQKGDYIIAASRDGEGNRLRIDNYNTQKNPIP